MGGELKECGCFDGPFAADDPTLVSVRCDEHFAEGNLSGYVLMRRGRNGHAYRARTSSTRPKMATIKGRRR